ncbi:MAG: hypothetical protein ACRC1M_07220 [Methanobacteriaceae archaeon]
MNITTEIINTLDNIEKSLLSMGLTKENKELYIDFKDLKDEIIANTIKFNKKRLRK